MTFKVYPYETVICVDAIDRTLPDGTEESHGYFILNNADELFLLRDTINKTIEKYNLTPNIEMKKSSQSKNTKRNSQNEKDSVSGHCIILEGYLKGWAPAPEPGPGVIYKTTREIIDDLEDMIEIEPRDVASVMSQIGFRAHYEIDGGPHGWMMRKVPGTIHIISPTPPDNDD